MKSGRYVITDEVGNMIRGKKGEYVVSSTVKKLEDICKRYHAPIKEGEERKYYVRIVLGKVSSFYRKFTPGNKEWMLSVNPIKTLSISYKK